MAFTRITAAEAAALIKNGDNIGLSGFTPAGTPKAVTAEIAKIAHAEHEAGRPYQIGIFTGASTGQSCDGVLSDEQAIRYRAPYTTNSTFRKHVNAGEIAYNDIPLKYVLSRKTAKSISLPQEVSPPPLPVWQRRESSSS